MRFTKLNYCQYLLSSQINYTITNLAEHLEQISHDKINRYLKNEKLTPRLLWDNVKDLIEINDNAYLIFDDTVLDKRYATEIETSKRQYSAACRREEYSFRRTALVTNIVSSKVLG
jgi:hypothetical protein